LHNIFFSAILSIFFFDISVCAEDSQLGNFEAGVSRPGYSGVANSDTSSVSYDTEATALYTQLFISALKFGLLLPQAFVESMKTDDISSDQKFDLRILYGNDKRSLSHIAGDGRLAIAHGFGLTAGYLGYREKNAGRTEHLEFYRSDVRYQIGSLRNSAGLELGGRWMTGGIETRSGLDGAVTVDLSLHPIFHFDTSYRISRLSASTIRESAVGITAYYKGIGARIGYRNLDSGVNHLEGFEAGLGLSF